MKYHINPILPGEIRVLLAGPRLEGRGGDQGYRQGEIHLLHVLAHRLAVNVQVLRDRGNAVALGLHDLNVLDRGQRNHPS